MKLPRLTVPRLTWIVDVATWQLPLLPMSTFRAAISMLTGALATKLALALVCCSMVISPPAAAAASWYASRPPVAPFRFYRRLPQSSPWFAAASSAPGASHCRIPPPTRRRRVAAIDGTHRAAGALEAEGVTNAVDSAGVDMLSVNHHRRAAGFQLLIDDAFGARRRQLQVAGKGSRCRYPPSRWSSGY